MRGRRGRASALLLLCCAAVAAGVLQVDPVMLAAAALDAPTPTPPYSLAMCTMFYNEGKYLLEWILYHYLIGFQAWLPAPAGRRLLWRLTQPSLRAALLSVRQHEHRQLGRRAGAASAAAVATRADGRVSPCDARPTSPPACR